MKCGLPVIVYNFTLTVGLTLPFFFLRVHMSTRSGRVLDQTSHEFSVFIHKGRKSIRIGGGYTFSFFVRLLFFLRRKSQLSRAPIRRRQYSGPCPNNMR